MSNNEIKVGDVVVLRLISGEEIIATISENEQLEKIRVIVHQMNPRNGEISVMMVPFLVSNNDAEVIITDAASIMFPVRPSKEVEDMYVRMVSPIDIVTSSPIIGA